MMQDLRKSLASLIFKPEEKKIEVGKEEAYSETSVLYGKSDFTKYNPDDLIGRKGFAIYKKMKRDEQVKAAVKFKRDAITSRDFVFMVDEQTHKISKEEAQRRINLFYHITNNLNGTFMDALNGIMTAIENGFSMTEVVLDKVEFDGLTWQGVKALKLRPFDTFVFDVDPYGNV